MPRNNKDSELILGLITTVGTNVDEVIKDIREHLVFFNYKVEVISVSEQIISQFDNNGTERWPSEFDRISHFMDLGNRIRSITGDNSILMKGVAREIFLKRDKDDNGYAQPRPRVAYIKYFIKPRVR